MTNDLQKRLYSFLWRLGAVMVIAGLNFIIKNISELGLPVIWVTVIGLLLGEVTKFLNNKYQLGKTVLAGLRKK